VVGFYAQDAEVYTIDIDGADKINLDGTALAAGNTIDSAGAAGNFIFLISVNDADGVAGGTDGWRTLGRSGTHVDGGAT
jgi:acetyl-CoA acetyltransferase